MHILDYARAYRKKGFSVIPLKPKDKRPVLASWTEFQTREPTEQELLEWFNNGAKNNIGIVTGGISGIVVIDLDSEEALAFAKEKLPLTLTPRSGRDSRKGRHDGQWSQD